jgi:hypothetical protein
VRCGEAVKSQERSRAARVRRMSMDSLLVAGLPIRTVLARVGAERLRMARFVLAGNTNARREAGQRSARLPLSADSEQGRDRPSAAEG